MCVYVCGVSCVRPHVCVCLIIVWPCACTLPKTCLGLVCVVINFLGRDLRSFLVRSGVIACSDLGVGLGEEAGTCSAEVSVPRWVIESCHRVGSYADRKSKDHMNGGIYY